jgi:hypothetical protein
VTSAGKELKKNNNPKKTHNKTLTTIFWTRGLDCAFIFTNYQEQQGC